jgi:hypothetical protein
MRGDERSIGEGISTRNSKALYMAQAGRRSRDQNVSWGAVEAIYRLGVSKSGKGCADYLKHYGSSGNIAGLGLSWPASMQRQMLVFTKKNVLYSMYLASQE